MHRDDSLPGAFRRVATAYPAAIAVRSASEELTYEQLLEEAAALAGVWRERRPGAGPMLLAAHRSVTAVVHCVAAALLGVPYRFCAEDGPTVVTASEMERLRADASTLLDPVVPEARCGPTVATLISTSGTTGTPLLIELPGKAIVTLLAGTDIADFGPGAVVPLLAPMQWDGFTLELWSVLLNGGTSWIPGEGQILGPGSFADLVADGALTTMWITSSLFTLLVERSPAPLRDLLHVLVGGEAVSAAHVRAALEGAPGLRMTNGYGPAECGIFTACHEIVDPSAVVDPLPVGRPVGGRQVAIVDEDDVVLPVGATGEIAIYGDGLALGYSNADAVAARRFRQVVIDGHPRRCYLSGDLGHLDGAGLLHVHGRRDHQVKIRGRRIELDGLEARLRAVPEIGNVAIVAVGEPGPVALAAFVQLAGAASHASLRAAVDGAVDRHERPWRIEIVDVLPLLPNGKIDRRTLRSAAESARTSVDVVPSPSPKTAEDAVIALVGARAGHPVDRSNSLWSLGVSSLDLLDICATLSAEFGLPDLSAPALGLDRVGELVDLVASSPASAASRVPAVAPLALRWSQRSMWIQDRLTPHSTENLCTLEWWFTSTIDPARLAAAWSVVQRSSPFLRHTYGLNADRVPTLSDRPAALDPLTVLEPSVGVDAAIRQELARPLDLARGPIGRCVVGTDTGTGLTGVGFAVHHAAFDGDAEHLLATRLADAYGRPAATAAEPTVDSASFDPVDVAAQRARAERFWAGRLPASSNERRARAGSGASATIRVDHPGCLADVLDRRAREWSIPRLAVAVGNVVTPRPPSWSLPTEVVVGFALSRRAAVAGHPIACAVNLMAVPMAVRGDVESNAREFAAGLTAVAGFADLSLGEIPFPQRPSGAWGPPRIDAIVMIQDLADPELQLDGETGSFRRVDPVHLGVDLLIEMWTGPNELVVHHRLDAWPPSEAVALAELFLGRLT